MEQSQFADLTLSRALDVAGNAPEMVAQKRLNDRLASIATQMGTFKTLADRWDALFFTTEITPGMGPDIWPDDPSATTEGRSHISLTGRPKTYVIIPAGLLATQPVENMLATKDTQKARDAAADMERIRKAWKVEERWQLKRHKAATLTNLYGMTASHVYYDRSKKRGCADVIENPRNLWIGYKTADADADAVEWAAYVQMMDPSAVIEQFSVDFQARLLPDGKVIPWVIGPNDMANDLPHSELSFGPARVEVWDYWYREVADKGKRGEPSKMRTMNIVIAGNAIVRGPIEYEEYEGQIPYLPVNNDYIPGSPIGRSNLHDMEQLIREKMTRLTAGAQMIASATAGSYWQLTGQDAPSKVPAGAKPKLNEVATPGAGNRIEPITPFVAQFQFEQFMGRIDREMAEDSGLNDLLLGLVPASGLNSSKAINAMMANFETRIQMPRLLFYTWDKDTWDLVVKVWKKYDDTVRTVWEQGGGVLDIINPSLSPRDDFETAQRAINLMQNKVISQARAMDWVGVDDPEQEQEIIRSERTDATLWPADVQTMAQLMGILQSMGLAAAPGTQAQAEAQGASGTEALRNALGATAGTSAPPGSQYGTQPQTPPIEGASQAEGGGPFAQGNEMQIQSMMQKGQSTGRVLTNTKVPMGRR